jgi:peptide/nickel transport system ATP-binding protein
MDAPLLEVGDLSIRFMTDQGMLTAVDRLSFSVAAGETLAIIGESGCGKTVTGLALMRLLDMPPARTEGCVRLEGRDLLALSEREMRAVRGNRIAMVFQDPMATLDPVMTVGDQLVEAIRAHDAIGARAARTRAAELLDLVRIPDPGHRLAEYPHRLSGGLRQRVVIAMALASKPVLLVADEPTTALDVTIQAQVLRLLADLQHEFGMGLLLITHDLGVVAECAHRVLVMYAGRKVEEQSVFTLFEHPQHPYTQGLIGAKPTLQADAARRRSLREIPGMVPALAALGSGCAFAPRCALADDGCTAQRPDLRRVGAATVACHKAGDPLRVVAGER